MRYHPPRTLLLLATLLALALAPAPAHAVDSVVGDGTPASCTEAAFDAALATALSAASGTIRFSCGGPATITFHSTKTIRGPGFVPPARAVTIDGGGVITLDGGDAITLFYIEGDANPQALTLRRITISDGYSSFASGGGAVFNNGGALTLDSVTIAQSASMGQGGAILSVGGALQVIGSVLRDNAATSSGGAISSSSRTSISGSTLARNTAVGGIGGAVASSGDMELRDTQVISNTATGDGGGIASTGVLTITDSRISGNRSSMSSGGAISTSGRLSISTSTISMNEADLYGGGIYDRGSVEISRSTISQNQAGNQGGGIMIKFSSGDLLVESSTISGNRAGASGGGLFIHTNRLTTLRFVTLSGNTTVGQGSAIRRLLDPVAPMVLEGVVLDASAAGSNCSTLVLTTTPDSFSASSSLSSDITCFNDSGTNRVANPRLGALQDNGGPTLTHLPMADSPLLSGAVCPAGLAVDQRGLPRPIGAICDIGAVERQPDEGLLKVFLPLVQR